MEVGPPYFSALHRRVGRDQSPVSHASRFRIRLSNHARALGRSASFGLIRHPKTSEIKVPDVTSSSEWLGLDEGGCCAGLSSLCSRSVFPDGRLTLNRHVHWLYVRMVTGSEWRLETLPCCRVEIGRLPVHSTVMFNSTVAETGTQLL